MFFPPKNTASFKIHQLNISPSFPQGHLTGGLLASLLSSSSGSRDLLLPPIALTAGYFPCNHISKVSTRESVIHLYLENHASCTRTGCPCSSWRREPRYLHGRSGRTEKTTTYVRPLYMRKSHEHIVDLHQRRYRSPPSRRMCIQCTKEILNDDDQRQCTSLMQDNQSGRQGMRYSQLP